MISAIFFNPILASHSFIWYWEQCDEAAKVVIYIIAVLIVFVSNSIAQKFLDLHKYNKQNKKTAREVDQAARISRFHEQKKPEGPYAKILESAAAISRKAIASGTLKNEQEIEICMDRIENAVQRNIAKIMVDYEKHLGVISTGVAIGPFLGLLGTVIGVIVTFGSLTEKATISQLAPGVSGALVATLAGLVLAIPSLFFYNIFLPMTKKRVIQLENFASSIVDRIEKELYEDFRRMKPAESLSTKGKILFEEGVPADEKFGVPEKNSRGNGRELD